MDVTDDIGTLLTVSLLGQQTHGRPRNVLFFDDHLGHAPNITKDQTAVK